MLLYISCYQTEVLAVSPLPATFSSFHSTLSLPLSSCSTGSALALEPHHVLFFLQASGFSDLALSLSSPLKLCLRSLSLAWVPRRTKIINSLHVLFSCLYKAKPGWMLWLSLCLCVACTNKYEDTHMHGFNIVTYMVHTSCVCTKPCKRRRWAYTYWDMCAVCIFVTFDQWVWVVDLLAN